MADNKTKSLTNPSILSEKEMMKYMGMKRHPVSGKLYTPGGPLDDTKELKNKKKVKGK